jgi:hypothetical protein
MAPSAEWQTGGALQTFGVPATHAPDWHVSAPLQALPSEQLVPFVASGYVHWPVAGSHVAPLLVRQTGGLLQSTGVPAVHWPATHVSLPLQRSLSAHDVPSVTLGYEHWPLLGLHVAPVAVWHGGGLLHTTAVPAEHTPFWQVSAPSQALPFEQLVPFGAFGYEHWPVEGSHCALTSVLHVPGLLHTIAVPAVHAPATQVSLPLQRSLSAHEVPSITGGYEHCPSAGLHVAFMEVRHVGGLLQTTAVPGVHTPDWHVSSPSHAFPFEHGVPFGTLECEQPSSSQVSTVQGLLSLQFSEPDAVQVPFWQVASSEQIPGSVQGVPFISFG